MIRSEALFSASEVSPWPVTSFATCRFALSHPQASIWTRSGDLAKARAMRVISLLRTTLRLYQQLGNQFLVVFFRLETEAIGEPTTMGNLIIKASPDASHRK